MAILKAAFDYLWANRHWVIRAFALLLTGGAVVDGVHAVQHAEPGAMMAPEEAPAVWGWVISAITTFASSFFFKPETQESLQRKADKLADAADNLDGSDNRALMMLDSTYLVGLRSTRKRDPASMELLSKLAVRGAELQFPPTSVAPKKLEAS